MSDLLLRMNQSVAKAQDAASTTYQVLTGPVDNPVDVNGQEVPTLSTRVRDYINNSVSDVQGDDGISLELLEIRADGHLWAKLEGLPEEDLGKLVPDDPIGVSDVNYDEFSGNLTITLTDGTINGPFNISGENASVPQFAEIDEGNLKITLEDDTVLDAGDVSRFGGRSANGADVSESGDLIILFSDGTTKNIGRVRGDAGEQGYSIVTAGIDQFGVLRFLRSDGKQATAGLVNATILDNAGNTVLDVGLGLNDADPDELVISLESGDLNLGKVVGEDAADGTDGRGIKSIDTDADGNVVYTLSDNKTHTVGKLQVTRVFNAGNTNISEAKIDEATGELLIDVTVGGTTTTERLDVVTGADGTILDKAEIDQDSSELIFTDKDGGTINAGAVEQVTITGVEVTNPNGFLQITTSDGSRFTSKNSVIGSDGADATGISDAYLSGGDLMIAFDDENIPDANVGNVTASAETGVDLTDGELTLTLSDGQTFGPFTVQGQDGKYLTAAEMDQGELYVTYSDDPSNKFNIGKIEQHPVNAKINPDNTLTIEFDDGSSVKTTERVGAVDGDTVDSVRYDSANNQIIINYTTDNRTNSQQVNVDVIRGYGVGNITYDPDGGMVNVETTIPGSEIIQFPAPKGKDGGSINDIYKDNEDLVIEYINRGETAVNEFRAEGVYASGTIENIEVDANDNLAIFVDTLQDPLVFQTLKGADGNTITNITFNDRDLVISTSEQPDSVVPLVRGEDGLTIDTIGTNDANDELSIGMSDGTSVSFPQKRGFDASETIVDIRLGGTENRDLIIEKTDETLTVPLLKGEDGTTMKNIDLSGTVFSFDVQDGTEVTPYSFDLDTIRGTDGKSITDIAIGGATGRDLIITTNLPEPDDEIVIPVVKGEDGVTVDSISMVNDDTDIEILLSDTTKYVLNGVGASVTGAEVTTDGKLKLTLSDGTDVTSTNMVRGRNGLGIGVVDASFVDGQLTVTIEDPDGTQTDIDAGDVSMVGVTNARIEEDTQVNEGILFIELEDGSEIEVGNVYGKNGRYVKTAELSAPTGENDEQDLLLTFSDGVQINAGNVTGQAARSVSDASVGFAGDFTIEYDDGTFELVGNIGTGAGLSVWDSSERPYVEDQVVIHNGGLYMSTTGNNNDQPPSDKWKALAFGDQVIPIRKPIILSPITSAENARPRLEATEYAPIVSEDELDFREFQIDTVTGDFSNPVYTSSEAKNYHDMTGTDLTNGDEYKIRVRDTSIRGDISEWSDEKSFTVPTSVVETPILNIHPDEDATDAFIAPEWQTSAFSMTSGTDTHASTSWEVVDGSGNLVYTSLDDTENLLSILIPEGNLTKGVSYQIRAKHNGSSVSSGWSDYSNFTVSTMDYIKTPVLTEPNDGVYAGSLFEKTDAFAAYSSTELTHDQSVFIIMKISDGSIAEIGTVTSGDLTRYERTTNLESNETYRVTVEYFSNRFGTAVSGPYEFTFTQSIAAPTVSTTEDINAFPVDGTVTTSAFSAVNEKHISTDWEMRKLTTDEVLFSSYDDTENLTQISIGPFVDANDYYVRARYNGEFISSDWSNQLDIYYNGKTFALYSGGDDQTLRKIKFDGTEQWSINTADYIYALTVDSDGYAYYGLGDNTVRKIDRDGGEVWKFSGHTNTVKAVVVNSSGYVYSASNDNTVRKIAPNGDEVTTGWPFTGHSDAVNSLSIDSNGYVYTGSTDNTVKKINPNGTEELNFSYTSTVYHVISYNNYIYVLGGNGVLKKVNPDGSNAWTFDTSAFARGMTVDSNTGDVYLGLSDNTVKKVDSTGNEVTSGWPFTGHTDQLSDVSLDDSGYVYTVSYDNTVRKISSDGNEVTSGWPFTEHSDRTKVVAATG